MATIEELLRRLANERAAPLPEPAAPMSLGPLSNDTSLAFGAQNPEPVPNRIVQPAPVDMAAVNQSVGPAPVRPTLPQPGLLERILTTIGGVGAGIQGNAAPYIEQVRRQRNAPIEQFERDQAVYNQRRDRAFEIAERRAERQAEMETRALEAAYERDHREWLEKNKDRSDDQKERRRQAVILERDARAARLEEEREQRRELRARQDDARSIAARYGTGPGAAPPAVAKEIGEYIANLREGLSPLAARWWNAQARRTGVSPSRAGGVSKAAVAVLQRWELARQARIAALQRGDAKAAAAYKQAEDRAIRSGGAHPAELEIGETIPGYPYMKMRGQQSAPAPAGAPAQPQGGDPLGLFKQ